MRVFVTGGSGLLGGNLIQALVARGDAVAALARSDVAARRVAQLGAEPIRGDLFAHDAIAHGARGADLAFHVAGRNETCPRDVAGLYRDNVDGAVAVVDALAAAGVPRIVHTSSAAAIGEPEGVVADETTPPVTFPSDYARSKHLGEAAAFAAAERTGIDLVAVLPSSVQGPGRSGGSAKLLIQALRSRRPLIVETALSIVDIDDCTAGHLAAADRGVAGRRYLLNGSTATASQILALIAETTGRSIRPIVVPGALLRLGSPLAAVIHRLAGTSLVCPDLLRTLTHGHRFDAGRSERELGLTYRPLADTIARTLTWLRDEGLVD